MLATEIAQHIPVENVSGNAPPATAVIVDVDAEESIQSLPQDNAVVVTVEMHPVHLLLAHTLKMCWIFLSWGMMIACKL